METLFDKLGIYDFFNVVVSGAAFLISVFMIFPTWYSFIDNAFNKDLYENISFLLFCYVFGVILQEIGGIIEDKLLKTKDTMTGSFLLDGNNVIGNGQKTFVYQKLAKGILRSSGIELTGSALTKEQSVYIFGYCAYYIEIREKNHKIEKIRSLYGMAKNLIAGCFILCFLVTIHPIIIREIILKYYTVILPVIIVVMIILKKRMERNMRYLIRMTMGVYEACCKEKTEE